MVGRRDSAGFTLPELLIATAVSVIALGLAASLLRPAAAAFHSLPEAVDAQQRLRIAVQAIAEDIAGAGSGPSLGWSARAAPAWPAVLPCRWAHQPLATLPGGCARDDAMTVLAVPIARPQVITAENVEAAESPIRVAALSACSLSHGACRMHAGSPMLLADGTGAWDVVALSAVSADGTLLEHAGAPLSWRYREGAIAAEVETSAYSLRFDAASDAPQLRRSLNGSADMPLVDHVTALRFEYFGAADPPEVVDDADPARRRTSYGLLPPPDGVDNALDAWDPGENCLFSRGGGLPSSRLAPLPVDTAGLARLPVTMFGDGPWCPDGASPNRFDGDLLRVKLVRVVLRVEAQSLAVRGVDPEWFSRRGAARDALRLVPDLEVRVDVALRNVGR
jgi:prepilin-type N-terminal cleavage/methylation domain-containing protein